MPDSIANGGEGPSVNARVNENQRVYTQAVSESTETRANKSGDAYNLNTGEITLTDANETPIAYLKNLEEEDFHIIAIAIGMNFSTDGSATEMARIKIIRNPTAGGTITNENNADIKSNRNYGSQKTLNATWYKGATGEAVFTGGDDHIIFMHNDGNRLFATIEEILPQNTAMGIQITPPASNSSMDVYVALIGYLTDPRS